MFDNAFQLLMINEGGDRKDGGFVDDPSDNGGETKFGISRARYPNLDIKKLTRDEAKEIYENDFWLHYQCDKMPWPIAWTVFDCVVNHNATEAIRWLQIAVGVTADGILGAKTMAAIKAVKEPINVARDITLARRDYCEGLHNYDSFKAGWNRRHLDTLIGAVQWESQA